MALGPQRGLGAVGDVDGAEDARQVRLDRLLADLEAAGDELVRQPLDEQLEDLALAGGEAVGLGARGEDGARGAGVERGLAAGGRADALRDLVRGGVLEQVADRAGVHRAEDAGAVGERGQHQHAGRRCGGSPRCRRAPACRGPSGRRRARATPPARPPPPRPPRCRPARGPPARRSAARGRRARRRGRRPPAPGSSPASMTTVVPVPGRRAHLSVPPERADEVLEQRQADVALLAAPRALGGVEAAAVVAHLQAAGRRRSRRPAWRRRAPRRCAAPRAPPGRSARRAARAGRRRAATSRRPRSPAG